MLGHLAFSLWAEKADLPMESYCGSGGFGFLLGVSYHTFVGGGSRDVCVGCRKDAPGTAVFGLLDAVGENRETSNPLRLTSDGVYHDGCILRVAVGTFSIRLFYGKWPVEWLLPVSQHVCLFSPFGIRGCEFR